MIISFHQCRNTSFPFPVFAWLIMIFQGMTPWGKKSYSHMALSIDGYFFDSRFNGTQFTTEEEYLKTYDLVDTIELVIDADEQTIFDWFMQHEGKAYDFRQLFGLLAKYLHLIKVNTMGRNTDKLICSELLIDFLICFKGIDIADTDDYGLLDTWKLLESLDNKAAYVQ